MKCFCLQKTSTPASVMNTSNQKTNLIQRLKTAIRKFLGKSKPISSATNNQSLAKKLTVTPQSLVEKWEVNPLSFIPLKEEDIKYMEGIKEEDRNLDSPYRYPHFKDPNSEIEEKNPNKMDNKFEEELKNFVHRQDSDMANILKEMCDGVESSSKN
ncbi:MAG: hypothetical protein GY874_19700 [Desulfobacteraceae bacterium]|nr:hypothetical protein [Desulfobacteraceae bacterium]